MKKPIFYDDLKTIRITTVAGAWVFYFLNALLPTAFLLISAFAVFGVDLTEELVLSLPKEYKEIGEAVVKTAGNAGSGVTVFFIISILFSGSAFLHQTCVDGEYIYGVKRKHKNGFLRRIWAMIAFGILFCVFLATAFLFAFERFLLSLLFGSAKRAALTVAAFAVVIVSCFFIVVLLNKFVSPIKIDNSDAAFGSFISVAVMVLGTIGFSLYLRFFSGFNAFYGTLATAFVFLLWVYILMLGLVLGVATSKKSYFYRAA